VAQRDYKAFLENC